MKTMSNINRLKNLLKTKGLKPTYQRLKILEYLDKHMDGHPTVEMIYEALSREIPTLSMTTIYNAVNAFLDRGLVSAVTITGTEVRYDFTTSHHHHFLCKKCGRIIDIDIQCPVMERNTNETYGHKIQEVHGYFKGLCKDCLKKANVKAKH